MKYRQNRAKHNTRINRLARSIIAWERGVIRAVESIPTDQPDLAMSTLAFLTSPEATSGDLIRIVSAEYAYQAEQAGSGMLKLRARMERKKGVERFSAKDADPEVTAYMIAMRESLDHYFRVERERMMVNIAIEVQDKILDTVSSMLADGQTVFEIQQAVSKWLPDDGSLNGFFGTIYRAERIARTEAGLARNKSLYEGAKKLGMKGTKEWVAALQPGRTRPSHLDMHGQVRDIDEPYNHEASGNAVMFPCDPSLGASPDFTIQCRCSQVFDLEL